MKKISIYNVEPTPIGTGGMGSVYLGYDPKGKQVAIKEMRAELITDSNLRDRFIQEINLMSTFDHDNIVRMHASFSEGSNIYLVMEYIEGETFEKYVRDRGRLEEKDAVRILDQVLDAMQYVHSKGVIHRDIKPSNVMIRKDNGKICLLDFGIAKDLKGRGLTTGQLTIGTNGYMSPEQAEGYQVDHRTDIYSLGCVLYYMLTGAHAIEEQRNAHETQIAVINNNIKDVKLLNPNISDFIANIQRKSILKNMTQRFQSCRDFQIELSGGKTVAPTNSNRISIGRGDCDIKIYDPQQRVSSHHADIEKIEHTGNTEYIFYDRSTNGTLINGEKIHRTSKDVYFEYPDIHPSSSMRRFPAPQIFLACLTEYPLNWNDVMIAFQNTDVNKTLFDDPYKEQGPVTAPKPPINTQPFEGESAKGWLIAIYIFAVLGGLLGVIFGITTYRDKIQLSDGNKAYKYKQSHRSMALVGAILSIISMLIWRIALI